MIDDPDRLLGSVQWELRDRFEELTRRLQRSAGLGLRVRSGLRSCADQNALYAEGRTVPGNIVTYAPGCYSWHVHGRAVDADPVDPRTGATVESPAHYQAAGLLWEQLGGVWGGRFEGFGGGDVGHFEWHPGLTLAAVCADPARCTVAPIQTSAPLWPWVAAGGLVLGASVWLFGDELGR